MEEDMKTPKSESMWLRLGYMLLFILFYSLAEALAYAVMFVQFLLVLITRKPNERLKRLGGELGIYVKEIIGYITYYHDRKVFPFVPWEKADSKS